MLEVFAESAYSHAHQLVLDPRANRVSNLSCSQSVKSLQTNGRILFICIVKAKALDLCAHLICSHSAIVSPADRYGSPGTDVTAYRS
jgi:hypothetical protein